MKKIAVVTGARSEYGLLRWVIDEIHHATELQLQLIVTGGHLSPEQGLTYRCIEEDGYDIDAKVDMLLSSDCASGIAKSITCFPNYRFNLRFAGKLDSACWKLVS